jgi:hypothetical protein
MHMLGRANWWLPARLDRRVSRTRRLNVAAVNEWLLPRLLEHALAEVLRRPREEFSVISVARHGGSDRHLDLVTLFQR